MGGGRREEWEGEALSGSSRPCLPGSLIGVENRLADGANGRSVKELGRFKMESRDEDMELTELAVLPLARDGSVLERLNIRFAIAPLALRLLLPEVLVPIDSLAGKGDWDTVKSWERSRAGLVGVKGVVSLGS